MADQDEQTAGDVIATEQESKAIYLPFVGMTVGELINQMRAEVTALDRKLAIQDAKVESRDREIAAHHQTITAKNVKIAELEKAVKESSPEEAERLRGLVQVHGGKIAEILSTLYGLMIDPLFDGKLDPELAFAQIKAAAETQRQQLEDAQGLAAQAEGLKNDLGVARMLLRQAQVSGIPKGIEHLEGGGIRLGITLDVDETAPLLSWAESAGEDPAEYIAKTLKDALVAVTSS